MSWPLRFLPGLHRGIRMKSATGSYPHCATGLVATPALLKRDKPQKRLTATEAHTGFSAAIGQTILREPP
jgi:hypothetical protein